MNEFTFRKEWYDAVECIDEEYQLDAICAIANYAFFGSEPEWDLTTGNPSTSRCGKTINRR